MRLIANMKAEMQDVLQQNILRFWLEKMTDRENGGFYGRIDGGEVLHPEAEKGAILNARILWTFSSAFRLLGRPEYRTAADRAFREIRDRFADPEWGIKVQQGTARYEKAVLCHRLCYLRHVGVCPCHRRP